MDSNKGSSNHSTEVLVNQQRQQQQVLQLQQMIQFSSSSSGNFKSKDGGANYDLVELDQAFFFDLDGQDPSPVQDQIQNGGMRPPTLSIFPSEPMHIEPLLTKPSVGLVSSATSCGSKRPSESSNPKNGVASGPEPPTKTIKREGSRKDPTSSSEKEGPKSPDPKTLRRLVQNREAARKSRLRKKAYIQQLESSRIKLIQIEQELQRARSQDVHFGGGALSGVDQGIPMMNNISSGGDFITPWKGKEKIVSSIPVFGMEYARWLEEHLRLVWDLRDAVQEHKPENELRPFVDIFLAHHDELMNLKSMVTKSDLFHIVSGMWQTPAERCFMWMGGFRPSEVIKFMVNQIEPLTEQQLLDICGLQQSLQEAEEVLSQGLEALNQSLSDAIVSDALSFPPNMTNYMGPIAMAMNKLSTLEGFVREADNLRRQMTHRLYQNLTTHQVARCFLAIAEYFHRLRALSSLWSASPRQE